MLTEDAADVAGAVPVGYLVYDQRDGDAITTWADALFHGRVEILHPIFEGDETEVREYHEENLRTRDGVLIFMGTATEVWLRRKMREVQKSAGYGRTGAAPSLAICLLEPRTPEKDRFRSHEALVIQSWDAAAQPLAPFVARLRGHEGRPG